MRARKAERCVQRAENAIDNGAIADADSALAEARGLDPAHNRLQELSDRLDALKHPLPEPQSLRRGWTGVAVAFGLILMGIAGWEVWTYRGEFWTYRSQLTPSIAMSPPEIDERSGLAAAGPALVPATVPSPSTVAPPPTPPSSDIVVRTEIVRPETIAEAQVTASETASAATRPTTQPPASTATTGKFVGTIPSTVARNSSAPINPPPVLEAAAPSLDYAAPSTLPAMASTSTPSFIPSIVPPSTESASASRAAAADAAPRDPSPAAPAPVTAASSPPPSPARDQSAAVRVTLGRYESAYNRLDVAAVQSVWPTIDHRALSRAFDNLTSQHVSLQACTIDVIGATARANCSGTASWTPKIGSGERSSARQWTFNLNQAEGGWRITQVQAR